MPRGEYLGEFEQMILLTVARLPAAPTRRVSPADSLPC